LSGEVELEAWVTAVTLENYSSTRSNRSAANPDDLDSDDDGVDDGSDEVLATALELENKLLSQTKAAADSISKRSARTGRSQVSDMSDTIDEVQATLESCSDDVCVTVRENADVREKLVQQAQGHVENGEWDDAAAAVDEVRDIVEGDIERLENGGNSSPIYEGDQVGGESALNLGHLAPPRGDPLTEAEQVELVEYLSGSPMVGERFAVCLPDAEVPGGDESLAGEVTLRRFIDYVTGRADENGKLYAWGSGRTVAGDDDDDDECSESVESGSNEILCKSNHLEANLTGPFDTGGGLVSLSDGNGGPVTVTVVNSPPTVSKADTGPPVLVCPVDGEAYEPSDLSEWGSESGSSSETPTIICQVMVQPPECPVPIRALLYVKRCRSDDQLVYTGGWVLDTAGLYEESVTALTVAGETQVVGIECCFDYTGDGGIDDLGLRGVSGERARRGARIESGTIESLGEAGVLADDESGKLYCWGDGSSSKAESGSCGETDGADSDVVVTHCPLDAPVLHLVNAGSASNGVKFKAGAELSKSVN
jgi:hypothetical protein